MAIQNQRIINTVQSIKRKVHPDAERAFGALAEHLDDLHGRVEKGLAELEKVAQELLKPKR